jgi:acyl-CoA thioesterase-1
LKKRYYFFFFTLLMLLVVQGCGEDSPSPEAKPEKKIEGTIVAVGDSLTEGLGVDEEFAYPAVLEKKLQAQGYRYRVINAGISGETSSGTLSRIKWVLTLKPDIVILVIGANDGLRGIDPALIESNIRRIIQALKAQNVVVVLGGMKIVRNLGQEYISAFSAIYPAVAESEGVIFIPFFLAGVAADPGLNQSDGIHPTAAGYRKVVDNIYPYVERAISKLRETKK